MSDAILADMQRVTRLAAEPRTPDDSTKAAIRRAALCLGLTYRRARSFWYGTPTVVVRAEEADRLRQEELRLIARERIRIKQRLAWVEARLDARNGEGFGNAQETSRESRKADVPIGPPDRRSWGVAGAEGAIDDPRQVELL